MLQNIFVKVDDVLDQIERKGRYEPPGIFMRYFGYVWLRIRDKPILVDHLVAAKDYISVQHLDLHRA